MRKSYPLTLLLTHVHHSIYYPFLSTIIVPPNKKICYTHHCVEYGRIKIFSDPCFPQLDNLQGFFVNLSKYGKIRVRGNPYSCIFCALHNFPCNMIYIACLCNYSETVYMDCNTRKDLLQTNQPNSLIKNKKKVAWGEAIPS